MSTQYRVVRADTLAEPVGMASIIYLGGSKREATQVMLDAELKRDAWNQPNDKYGVVLFEWYDLGKRYVPVSWRGIQTGGTK